MAHMSFGPFVVLLTSLWKIYRVAGPLEREREYLYKLLSIVRQHFRYVHPVDIDKLHTEIYWRRGLEVKE